MLQNTHTGELAHTYAFSLGREWKLSLAELFSVFGRENYRAHSETIAIFMIKYTESELRTKFRNIGGSIRLMRILGETNEKRFPTDVIGNIIHSRQKISDSTGETGGKTSFALGSYGGEYRCSDIGLRIKKTLSEKGLSARLINTENKNINAAAWKKEKLGKNQNEYNIIFFSSPVDEEDQKKHHQRGVVEHAHKEWWRGIYLATTIACQDIDAYARRDLGKSRDMMIGMMPPKLVQMMINLAAPSSHISLSGQSTPSHSFPKKNIEREKIPLYDPFCGLGTTLIEAANMGYTSLCGSDISSEMVSATRNSMGAYIQEEKIWQDRIRKAGGTPSRAVEQIQLQVWQMDAGRISECKENIRNSLIISEGYLGEIFSPHDISLDRVKNERTKLAKLYNGFFAGLKELDFQGIIVMSFPFWNIRGTYSYFTEIYDVIEKCGFGVAPLLPSEMKLNTMKGSLLYRRESQTVGREIVKIIPKIR